MWRWVTRGLVVSFLSLIAGAALAQELPPFIASLDQPDPGNTQSGIVFVKGFVLDQQQVSRVELYVDDQFQHVANMGLPRIDVIEAYPNWPGIQNSAPGFQTGFLASRFSTGPHTVSVKIVTTDAEAHEQSVEVGRRVINIDNTQNQGPFGFIDIPDPKGIYNAGGSFPVSGWATDTDGIDHIDVAIDNLILQGAVYGDSRPDVANTFPDFPAAQFSGFIANIDTTRIEDGVHLLSVTAVDRKGLSRLIGRRTVQIFNADINLKPFGFIDEPRKNAVLFGTLCGTTPPPTSGGVSPNLPVNPSSHITPVRGWALDLAPRTDVGRVSYVELLIDGARWASTDNCSFSTVFGTFTNCYGLPRFDVQRYYPTYPDSPHSGFLFTMDVGALIALGVHPGNHVLKVRVGDQQGNVSEIPNRDGIPVFFTCADDTADFAAVGAIDFPSNFDFVKGTVIFQGWAVDENGGVLAVDIFVDGNFLGTAQLGFPRPDVQVVNPFITGSATSGWHFTLDTTRLSNSRHQLTVRVRDVQGHAPTEIGSVDFFVQNPPPASSLRTLKR